MTRAEFLEKHAELLAAQIAAKAHRPAPGVSACGPQYVAACEDVSRLTPELIGWLVDDARRVVEALGRAEFALDAIAAEYETGVAATMSQYALSEIRRLAP